MNKPNSRGGKRPGAGRPKGSGKGRTVESSSINLPPALWTKLDRIRGEKSRSQWVAAKVKRAKDAPIDSAAPPCGDCSRP